MLDALALSEEKYRENPAGPGAWEIAYAHAALDQPGKAMEWLEISGSAIERDIVGGDPEAKQWVFRQARVYAWIGEKDLALQWLEKAYEMRAPKVIMLNHLFEFDSIREEPRFREILRRLWG